MPADSYDSQYTERGLPSSPIANSTFNVTPGNVEENTPGGDVINFKPYVAPVSTAPKLFDPASVIGPPPVPGAGGPIYSSLGTDMRTPSEIEKYNLQPHQDALQKAREYYNLATEVTNTHNTAQTHIDSGNFLTGHAKLDKTSPTYLQDRADLLAANPYASGPLVQDEFTNGTQVHNQYNEALKTGGRSMYEDNSPEQKAFDNIKGSPAQKHAAAQMTQKGEAGINAAVASGLPEAGLRQLNKDGTTNYTETNKAIATAVGTGESTKAQAEQMKGFDATIRELGPTIANMRQSDPKYAQINSLFQEAIAGKKALMDKQKQKTSGTAPTTAAPLTSVGSFLPPPRKPISAPNG
jgi:hypothetical protein